MAIRRRVTTSVQISRTPAESERDVAQQCRRPRNLHKTRNRVRSVTPSQRVFMGMHRRCQGQQPAPAFVTAFLSAIDTSWRCLKSSFQRRASTCYRNFSSDAAIILVSDWPELPHSNRSIICIPLPLYNALKLNKFLARTRNHARNADQSLFSSFDTSAAQPQKISSAKKNLRMRGTSGLAGKRRKFPPHPLPVSGLLSGDAGCP